MVEFTNVCNRETPLVPLECWPVDDNGDPEVPDCSANIADWNAACGGLAQVTGQIVSANKCGSCVPAGQAGDLDSGPCCGTANYTGTSGPPIYDYYGTLVQGVDPNTGASASWANRGRYGVCNAMTPSGF